MKHLAIDIETFSSADIALGVYHYTDSPDFRIQLFGYAVDGGPVQMVDIEHGEVLPEEVREALFNPSVTKTAHNATFERVCLSHFLGLPRHEYLDPTGWQCTMVMCGVMGLPLSLADAGAALGLDKLKLSEGKNLIKKFCQPSRQASLCDHSDWEKFKAYCIRDMEVEEEIRLKLSKFHIAKRVWDVYAEDQRINDRGVLCDMELVDSAIRIDETTQALMRNEAKELTGLENPNSAAQISAWLASNGVSVASVDKKTVAELRASEGLSERVQRVLELRQKMNKSSVAKYAKMKDCRCTDDRCRGMFQYYGSRTGRWAGRLVQLQNLPQNHIEDLDDARELVKIGDWEAVEMLYGNVQDTLSQLIRTAFIAKPGARFIVADYSAIEARVIAWYAGEQWRQEVFKNNGDIYCASASQMFKVPVVKHGVNGHLRQKGKIAELALGYGGGKGALVNMGALNMGLTEEELPGIVTKWREANPHICNFWWNVDEAARQAIQHPNYVFSVGEHLEFVVKNGALAIRLPSGRNLYYIRPREEDNIVFMGVGTTRKFEELNTYGPKLVENIVQATARDVLAESMIRLHDQRILMHVHDELIIEADDSLTLDDVVKSMCVLPSWAEGMILNADGYETPYYKKD